MVGFKRAVTACLLSALLITSMSLPVFAENEDIGTSDNIVVSDDTSIIDDSGGEITDAEQTDEPVDEPADDPVDETTDESSTESVISDEPQDEPVDDDSKPEESSNQQSSTVKQSSKTEESSKPEESSETQKQENQFSMTLEFGCNVLSNTYTDERIDFSKVSMTLLSADKKKVIKRYDIKSIFGERPITRTYADIVKVPSWKVGDKYVLHFDNLPDIYKVRSYDIPIVCEKKTEKVQGESVEYITGVDTVFDLSLTDILQNYNMLIFTYDLNYKPAPNVSLKVNVLADGKTIYASTVKTTNGGYAYLYVPWEKLPTDSDDITTQISTTSVVNGSIFSGKYSFPYVVGQNVYSLYADGSMDELLTDDDGNKIMDGAEIPVNVSFKNAFDMSIFESKDLNLELYNGATSVQSMVFNQNNTSTILYLSVGSKFTFKSDTVDYGVQINPTTLNVQTGTQVSVVAAPQLSLTVINEVGGVKKNAHFKISKSNSEYNEQSHQFAVNADYNYTVTNIETNKSYDVNIGRYKNTVINIANGEITQTGYIPSGLDEYENLERLNNPIGTTSSGSSSLTEVTSVPKTGDMILGVGLTLGGLTLLSFTAYEYYKRKGKKRYETKK